MSRASIVGVHYRDIVAALDDTGMIARGGFEPDDEPGVACVVVVGNVGGAIWERFEHERRSVPDPLDTWTRGVLEPIAASLGAEFVHPSDEPFRPFQRWAQLADDVWPSPIGLLIHRQHGLWHAYRGAFLFTDPVEGLPAAGGATSPCVACTDRPCLTTCPVDAFSPAGYDAVACRAHVRSDDSPDCLHDGCAARRACPIAPPNYDPPQMEFHMRAFLGGPHA